MKNILVESPKNNEIISQLISLYNCFKGLDKKEIAEFDLSNINWFNPFLILPLSAYINKTNSSFKLNENDEVNSYLSTIGFPTGISSINDFEQAVQTTKNYVPISVLTKDEPVKRSRLETCFQDIIFKITGAVTGSKSAIIYPIMELVGNIFHHSKEKQGYIFGQYYPKKNFLDICIVDTGRGLAKSYDDELGLKISDNEAINKVLSGISTKKERERGYGVRTSKNIVCKLMKGSFVLISGSSAYIMQHEKEQMINLPDFNWQGVIISYRIPQPTGGLDLYPYVEH